MTMTMAQDNRWMEELIAEHGRWVEFDDGTGTARLWESGYMVHRDNQGVWWPTPGWTNRDSATARRGAERFVEVQLEQAKAAVDEARQDLESDIAHFVETGIEVPDLDERKAQLAALHDAYLAAKEEHHRRLVEPMEKIQRRQQQDDERRQAVIQNRRQSVHADLQAISQFKTND